MQSIKKGVTLRNSKGFTLIELLVVIAIIGLLASIVLASLNSARKKARDARRQADLKQLQNALELYANDNGGLYPLGGTPATCGGSSGCLVNDSTAGLAAATGGLDSQYMTTLPADPLDDASLDHVYYYKIDNTTSPTQYCLSVELENDVPDGIPSDTCTVTPSNAIDSTTAGYHVGN